MNLSIYLKTFEGMKIVNRYNFLVLAALVICNFMLAMIAFENKERIILQPFTLTEDAWIAESDSSQGYKESWALFLAMTLGNVNPANVDFVTDRIKPMLSPRIYNEVVDSMQLQAEDIRLDRIVMRYEAKEVEYEPQTNRVFVFGDSVVRSADGEDNRSIRTFEFEITTANFAPVITHINSYEGRPRNQKMLQQMQQRGELNQ
ncbi:TraE/TraK family type IV conjugative transfer system protein [uncultured Umboniibacter sp.]|uniref:TraE/TraK family type IV conjugative transfer system protein n=1 Tax=uncultured Umboniibacter sp. TaxID=1798917 RepID=UPI0026056CC3|nr:TraE/TraK family type IV conjugative transfer system protein [uncultured Umboniibacter sp.]